MNPIGRILDEYSGHQITNKLRLEIQYRIAREMGVSIDDVTLNGDDTHIYSAEVRRGMRTHPINVMGRYEPVGYIDDSPALTKDDLDKMYQRMIDSFGTPDAFYADPATMAALERPRDRVTSKLEELRARISELEQLLEQSQQDVEHYKMLALEN